MEVCFLTFFLLSFFPLFHALWGFFLKSYLWGVILELSAIDQVRKFWIWTMVESSWFLAPQSLNISFLLVVQGLAFINDGTTSMEFVYNSFTKLNYVFSFVYFKDSLYQIYYELEYLLKCGIHWFGFVFIVITSQHQSFG